MSGKIKLMFQIMFIFLLAACGSKPPDTMSIGKTWGKSDVRLIQKSQDSCTLEVGEGIKDEIRMELGGNYYQGEYIFACGADEVTVTKADLMPTQPLEDTFVMLPFTRSEYQFTIGQYLVLQGARTDACVVEYRNENPHMGSEFIEIYPGERAIFKKHLLTCVQTEFGLHIEGEIAP